MVCIALTISTCRAGISQANQVASLGITNNGLGLTSDPVHFLDSPVLVTGATLLTNGECSLASPLQVSISSEDNASENEQSVYVATQYRSLHSCNNACS